MDWTAFWSGIVGAGFSSTLVGVLLRSWLENRLSIERERQAEERRLRYQVREASAAVAEILGEWIRPGYVSDSGEASKEDLWRIQTTYWKHILSLDTELVALLRKRLTLGEASPTNAEVIVQARKILLGLDEPDISTDEVVEWAPKKQGHSRI